MSCATYSRAAAVSSSVRANTRSTTSWVSLANVASVAGNAWMCGFTPEFYPGCRAISALGEDDDPVGLGVADGGGLVRIQRYAVVRRWVIGQFEESVSDRDLRAPAGRLGHRVEVDGFAEDDVVSGR